MRIDFVEAGPIQREEKSSLIYYCMKSVVEIYCSSLKSLQKVITLCIFACLYNTMNIQMYLFESFTEQKTFQHVITEAVDFLTQNILTGPMKVKINFNFSFADSF